jgi:polyketide biosynthesis acyl carrier protein
MNVQDIFEVIIRHVREVLPGLADHDFGFTDSLRELGANSVDRSEIISMTLDSLSLNIPLIEVARAQNIGELAGILHQRA